MLKEELGRELVQARKEIGKWWQDLSRLRKVTAQLVILCLVVGLANVVYVMNNLGHSGKTPIIGIVALLMAAALAILTDTILPRRERRQQYRYMLRLCITSYDAVFWPEYCDVLNNKPPGLDGEYAFYKAHHRAVEHVRKRYAKECKSRRISWIPLSSDLYNRGRSNHACYIHELLWQAKELISDVESYANTR